MIQGVFTALVTPFNHDGTIDLGAYKAIIQWQLEQGVDGLVPVGTTGESPTLESEEKELLIRTAVEAAAGKVPVIAGTGANSTKTAIASTIKARELGADMTLQVAPYYNKPSEEGLYRHFTEIAEKGGLPVVLYNVPGRSAVNMGVALLLRIAGHPGVTAIKEASGNMGQILELLNRRPKGLSILSGDDALTLPMMSCGGDGVISVTSNMFPREMTNMVHLYLEGKTDEAETIHNHLYPFFLNQFIETNPVPIKTYMAHKGLCAEVFRPPLCELCTQNRKILLSTFS
jgi:4-hydroxy-tetrahydrodipicolinate synthase